MREPHAKCVKIPRCEEGSAQFSRVFPGKYMVALALLKIIQKRVDSRNEFRRIRKLFAKKTNKKSI
jgi:hypothetical protein